MKPDSIWRLPSVGVVTLSNTGNKRELLYAGGYRRMDIQLSVGTEIRYENITELLDIGPSLVAAGWTLTGWQFVTGEATPAQEADVALQAIVLVKDLIKGHILNGEDAYEHNNMWKTSAYWDRFRQGSSLPVATWPMGSDAPTYAREFDYKSCVDVGCMVYPQQYANAYPGLTISNGDANLDTAGVPVENRGTSPGCYIGSGAESIPWDAYAADLQQIRRPVLLYAADLNGFSAMEAGKLVLPDQQEKPKRMIGSNNGITATFNRLRDKDPDGTLLKKDAKGKWPSISTLESVPLDKWKAYDKAERALKILVEDHDASA